MYLYFRMCRRPALNVIVIPILLLVCCIFVGLYFNRSMQDGKKLTPPLGMTYTPDHPVMNTASTRSSSEGPPITDVMSTSSAEGPFVRSSPTSSQGTYGIPGESEKVVFGGHGSDPGEFNHNYGVAVSADNEIFVTDLHNRRVQVFGKTGVFLRLFPTVVPGEEGRIIQPCDAGIDEEGHVWVVGFTFNGRRSAFAGFLRVVQYSKNGLPLTVFEVPHWARYPSIAVDLRNDRIVLEAFTEILVLKRNGSICLRFGTEQRLQNSYVTTDQKGNILVTVHSSVHVYDPSGRWRFAFGGVEGKHFQPHSLRGICVDRSGHILVADWRNRQIDMFTSRGEFVRTLVNNTYPWGIAVGPTGQLVMTNIKDSTVTIFPRRIILT
ncbi:tripartite motif-containing protein 3-like [Branchiostoma lanceolatum]|uniref:tripartite motif-containing protein 3-like n=1 Tax=Branchiostoma lanceolatum TaxID=7740 RepID=UPI00345534FC